MIPRCHLKSRRYFLIWSSKADNCATIQVQKWLNSHVVAFGKPLACHCIYVKSTSWLHMICSNKCMTWNQPNMFTVPHRSQPSMPHSRTSGDRSYPPARPIAWTSHAFQQHWRCDPWFLPHHLNNTMTLIYKRITEWLNWVKVKGK